MDYGTILVFLHPGLTDEQRYVTVKQSVENQLITSNRTHFNEILYNCAELSKIEPPLSVSWNLRDYKYTFKTEMLE